MAKKEAAAKVEKHDFTSELGKQNREIAADTAITQGSTDALKATNKGIVDQDNDYVYYDCAEDADDELDTDDDFEEIQPLNIKKTKTDEDSDHIQLATKHTEQPTQNKRQVHGCVEEADNLAQAQKNSAEVSHSAPLALEYNSSRSPTPCPKPPALHHFPDLLHPSPPLRRRKASMTLRKEASDHNIARGMMSKIGQDHDAHRSDAQDLAAEDSNNIDGYPTPTGRGKMLKAHGNQNMFSGDEEGNTAEIGQRSENFTSSENDISKRKKDAMLDYGGGVRVTPEKSTTNLVGSPKRSNEKKASRRFFHRKGSKECTTPPSSSSGNTAGRMRISAPTLIDASPDAKVLLNSARSLVDVSADAKHAVNYSRPIAPPSPSSVSNGSPVVHGRSSSALQDYIPYPVETASREGFADKPGNVPIGDNPSLICDHSHVPAVRGNQAIHQHGAIARTSAAEENPDASGSDSFNPSDYSGDENSVQQAVAMPIVFGGRAKHVNIRPPRGTNTAASDHRSGVGSITARGTTQLADHDAEALGAQDADRYYANSMISQTRRATNTTDDPFVDPAYQNLLAKPANEIAAKEMARIKAAREAGDMGGGLMGRMNALLVKSDEKPGVESLGNASTGPRAAIGGSLLSKMRALRKKPKKAKEQEDSQGKALRKVQVETVHGLREESEINASIKARLARREAANGGVRGAGIPRIDYGQPNLRTALGGCGPTGEERASVGTLESHHAASPAAGRMQDKEDITTARGRFEGY